MFRCQALDFLVGSVFPKRSTDYTDRWIRVFMHADRIPIGTLFRRVDKPQRIHLFRHGWWMRWRLSTLRKNPTKRCLRFFLRVLRALRGYPLLSLIRRQGFTAPGRVSISVRESPWPR